MKAIEQYFHVVLFIMLYRVLLTFRSVDKTLECDHSLTTLRLDHAEDKGLAESIILFVNIE